MSAPGRCATCRWWGALPYESESDAPVAEWRPCARVSGYGQPRDATAQAVTQSDDPYCESYLWTAASFGCVQWEAGA